MDILDKITLQKNQFLQNVDQRDIIREMDDHLMNYHESDDEQTIQQQYYDQGSLEKFVTLLLKLNSRKEGQTYQTKKILFFYIWKYYKQMNIFESNWQRETQQLEQQKRYPFIKMNKKRQSIEQQIFDLQRKHFFQYRQKQTLMNVVKNACRRERLLKTIAFHRFVRNIALQTNATNNNIFKTAIIQQQQIIQQKENNTNNNNKSRSKSPIASRTSLQQPKQQLQKNKGVVRICLWLQKYVDTKLQQRKIIAFLKWYKLMSSIRQLEQIEEINQINVILNERVHRDSLFRTKLQISQSEINQKISLSQELLFQLMK